MLQTCTLCLERSELQVHTQSLETFTLCLERSELPGRLQLLVCLPQRFLQPQFVRSEGRTILECAVRSKIVKPQFGAAFEAMHLQLAGVLGVGNADDKSHFAMNAFLCENVLHLVIPARFCDLHATKRAT